MNLAVTAAAYGSTVWAFQDGHLRHLLGLTPTSVISTTVLVTCYAMIFGISTDYEIFLNRRIQEAWHRTGDNTQAITEGIRHTAPVITAAAALMITLLAAFITVDSSEIQQFGFALAAAILIDATLVRIALIPAAMRLAGRWNWWPRPAVSPAHRTREPK